MNKKVIMFIPSIEDGGVEKNLYIVSNFLNKKKLKVEILTCNNDKAKNFDNEIKFIGTKNNFWHGRHRKIKYAVCLFILFFKLLIAKKKPLIFSFQANIYAIIISKILNTKVITRSNSSPEGWSKNFLKRILYKFIINFADDIMVNSIQFKNEFYKRFNIKVKCIYNPFKQEYILKKSKIKNSKFQFNKNFLNIVSIGRLTKQKDHLTLLKSANLINPKLKPRIIIVGKGSEKEFLNNYINKKNLKNIVKLVGYQSNPYYFIKNSDIIVLTSIFEGLPNVLLEAQFLKKYIISSQCPTGPKEILLNGKAGDLFKVGDYKKLAKIINESPKNFRKIRNKIILGSRNFKRFDYNFNCMKYLNFVSKNL